MAKTVTLPKSRNLGFCAIVAIVLLTSVSPLSASYSPATLDRIPALIGQEEVWEITKLEAVSWGGYSIMKYPSGIDVKNLINAGEEDITLAVISDCGWSRLIFIKTSWGNEIALDEFGAYGRWGRGSGEFRFPVGVAIGNYNNDFDPTLDFIYVVDAINHRIVMLRYDYYTNELSWFYSFGEENLINPRGILYYDNGTESREDDEIFITDSRLSQIMRFNSEGAFLGAYGIPGRNTGQIFTPYGICAGPSNSEWERFIYITDIYNYKICQFELDIQNNLEFRKEIVLPLSPSRSKLMGITSDAFGTIYVADRQRNCLLKISPDLELIAVINEETAGSDFRFFKPQVVRYHDNGLIVIDKFSETSGFKFFEVLSLGALKWSENWYGDIELKSDILVPCGTTLNLKPGAQIQVTPYYDENNLGIDPKRVEIIIEGTLNSNGTASDSVLIFSAGSPPNRGDWYGIRVQEPCGIAVLSHTSVRDAEYGIEFYDATTDDNHVYGFIKNSQLENNATAGVYANKGILDISGSMISDNSIYGFYGSKTDVDIRDNEFLRNGRYGIWINLLSNPADSVRILNNVIDGEDAATTIDGLYLAHSQARVEGCNIKGYSSTAAKVSSNTSPLFMLDTLECRVGMDCQLGASPTIRYCRIFHDFLTVGVNAGPGSFPHLGDLQEWGNNSVLLGGGLGYYVVNSNLGSVLAQHNWWGTDNPQPIRFNGPVMYFPWLLSEPPPPKQDGYPINNIPAEFFVSENYPNPFNPATRIDFNIPVDGQVTVRVYNLLGQLVNNLMDKHVNAGYHQIIWDATDTYGQSVGSGVYFINFVYGDQNLTKKALLLR